MIGDIALCLPLRSVWDDLAVDVFSDESLEPSVGVLVVGIPSIGVPVGVGEGDITCQSRRHIEEVFCRQSRKADGMRIWTVIRRMGYTGCDCWNIKRIHCFGSLSYSYCPNSMFYRISSI